MMKIDIKWIRIVLATTLLAGAAWLFLSAGYTGITAAMEIADQHPDDIGAAFIVGIMMFVVFLSVLFVVCLAIAMVLDHFQS